MSKFTKPAALFLFILAACFFTGCGNSGNSNQQSQAYTVLFESNGGGSVQSAQVRHGDALSAPGAPTRADHEFEGWYGDSERTAKVSFPYPVTRNITLYANWIWTAGVEIRTPAELDDVRNNLSGSYRLAADISLSSYAGWIPITYSDDVVGDGDGGLGWKFGGSDTAPWKMPAGGYPILFWQ